MKLEKFANVSSGLVITRKRARSKKELKKKYKLLTLKSFNDNGWIEVDELEEFNSVEILDERYLTKVGDIIIRLTEPYTAIPITKDLEGIVVSTLFCIISVNNQDIDVHYLSYMLNSEPIKKEYIRKSLGATIPVIRIGQLEKTNIPIVSKEKQKIIANIGRLVIKEKQLRIKLDEEIEMLNKQIELRIVKGGQKWLSLQKFYQF